MSKVQLSINKKPNGQMYRVTVEYKVNQPTELIPIQRLIQEATATFEPKDQNYIHLTLLHLGIPQDIYFELRKINPKLTMDEFMDRLMALLNKLHAEVHTITRVMEIRARQFDIYGSRKSPAVALKIDRTPELEIAHQRVYDHLIDFLRQFPIDDVALFIKNSRNFRHAPPEVFNPHITLGRLQRSEVIPSLPQPIDLLISKPYLAQVTVI